MKTISYLWPFVLLLAPACTDSDDSPEATPAAAPSEIRITTGNGSSATISWRDNSDSESGFSIWMKNPEADSPERIGFTSPNIERYTIDLEKLNPGDGCLFGVRADGQTQAGNSEIVYAAPFVWNDPQAPQITMVGEPIVTQVSVALRYRIDQLPEGATAGICWSKGPTPTISDDHQDGPAVHEGETLLQVIPNCGLDYGPTYRFRVYLRTDETVHYGKVCTAALESEPEPIILKWTELHTASMPASISVFETTDRLNGRNFHAWYAVADLSKGEVEIRVNIPDNLTTIDNQAASFDGACCIMTNGGYFYNTSHVGLAYVDSKAVGYIPQIQGSLRDDEENQILYNVTRGIFGVDASGRPAVHWAGTTNGIHRFYDRPLPSVKGEAKYAPVSDLNPTTPLTWAPVHAVSAGPVLLKEGKCPFDFTLTDKGSEYYLNNYEIMPYDIFGPAVRPDRTAVGRTADGKVILFICDGRIPSSDGATLTELAMILKGLGCVEALNLDGGGSTGMMVGNNHVNDLTGGNRKVKSAIGFFKKIEQTDHD